MLITGKWVNRGASLQERLSHALVLLGETYEIAHPLPTREEAKAEVPSLASNREGNVGSVR